MPHLDASALSADPAGMEFLRDILDVPLLHTIPVGGFDVKPSATVPQKPVDGEVNRPRRLELVSEPA